LFNGIAREFKGLWKKRKLFFERKQRRGREIEKSLKSINYIKIFKPLCHIYSINGCFQFCTGLKLRKLGSRKVYFFTCSRISDLTSSSFVNTESSETY
jgi:hypothetical protein